MKAQTYDKNYSNENLVIPREIWNNGKINGMQKMMLALIKKLTKGGTQEIDMMTKHMANIMATHLKDIEYNLKELTKKGFIEIYKNEVSKTGYSILYKYMPKPTQMASNDTSSLF